MKLLKLLHENYKIGVFGSKQGGGGGGGKDMGGQANFLGSRRGIPPIPPPLRETLPVVLMFLQASLIVWFTETFRLLLVQLSDFIGMPGLWVLAFSEGAGFIVAMFHGHFFNLKKMKCQTFRTIVLTFPLDWYRHPKNLCPDVHLLKSYACPNYGFVNISDIAATLNIQSF